MDDPDLLVLSVLGLVTISMAVVAITQKNMVRSIAAYAVCCLSLAMLFFYLASPFAAALELTVGAGLVSVLFLVALILGGGEEEEVTV